MSNAASFNLLKFVERRPKLSAGKIMSTIILCAVVLFAYYFFQVDRFRRVAEESANMKGKMTQQIQTLQPLLQQGADNTLVGVLSYASPQGEQRFYPEFEALTHVEVQGLWLGEVVIHRHPAFIKITGAMDAPDKLEQLLKQLALQPAFKNIQFVGVDVSKGLLPNVPKQYQAEISQLKIPAFYHFVIQTVPLKQSEVLA